MFELEAGSTTIPAEYDPRSRSHYLGEPVDPALETKFALYLRRRPRASMAAGRVFQDGAFNMSASVKAYFALKMIGDDFDAPHMRRAREAILARGGAIHANVFTRCLLSTLYSVLAGRACR